MLVLLVCRFHEFEGAVTWALGLLLVALGEGLRLWSVAVIGKESRTRGSGTRRLVVSGPYVFTRNPLYIGNLLLTLGMACLSELLWMIPIVAVLYAIQYVPIVLWEEQNLSTYFGADYAAYCRNVPRWLPQWPGFAPSAAPRVSYQWKASFWSERSTLATVGVLLLCMVAKEDLPHLPKYLAKHHVRLPGYQHAIRHS